MNAIAYIAAPGQSDFIPRKLVRELNAKPLIQYVMEQTALFTPHVYVLTDDEEIELICQRSNINTVFYEPSNLPLMFGSEDTLAHLLRIEKQQTSRFDTVFWIGASTPLIQPNDLAMASRHLLASPFDACFSASPAIHRRWKKENRYLPQYKVSSYRLDNASSQECGAFFAMKRESISRTGYEGTRACPFVLKKEHAHEIHTFQDWWIAQKLLKKRTIVCVTIGSKTVGMGHIYRSLEIAQALDGHDVLFLCPSGHTLAEHHIKAQGFKVEVQAKGEPLAKAVLDLIPDMVINDIMDTSIDYMRSLKSEHKIVINFEDNGEGACLADRVINALYNEPGGNNTLVGPPYFFLRSEFAHVISNSGCRSLTKPYQLLLTFGGVDEQNLSQKVVQAIAPLSQTLCLEITLITGSGYAFEEECQQALAGLNTPVKWIKGGTKKMSDYMRRAHVAVISAGCTLYECAAMAIPSIVIAQNERESARFHIEDFGMRYLGHAKHLLPARLTDELRHLLLDEAHYRSIEKKLRSLDLARARERVLAEIRYYLELSGNEGFDEESVLSGSGEGAHSEPIPNFQ